MQLWSRTFHRQIKSRRIRNVSKVYECQSANAKSRRRDVADRVSHDQSVPF